MIEAWIRSGKPRNLGQNVSFGATLTMRGRKSKSTPSSAKYRTWPWTSLMGTQASETVCLTPQSRMAFVVIGELTTSKPSSRKKTSQKGKYS